MKILNFFVRHKIFTGFLIFVFLIMATYVFLSPRMVIGNTLFTNQASEILSIAFDKKDMMRVNRVEVETPKGITVIEDPLLIKDIVDCTLVANNSGFKAVFELYYIRLYKDDILIRDMDLSLHNNLIRVYNSDIKHIVLLGGESGGYVFISDDLLERIQQHLLENGNSFGDADGTYI